MSSTLNSTAEVPRRYPLTGGDRGHERSFWGTYVPLDLVYRKTFHVEKASIRETVLGYCLFPTN